MALGRNIHRIERNIESIESKFAKIFKRPINHEDRSDFDDFWTESIVSTQSIFSKIFERTKNYRLDRIDRWDRSINRSYIDRWPPCFGGFRRIADDFRLVSYELHSVAKQVSFSIDRFEERFWRLCQLKMDATMNV